MSIDLLARPEPPSRKRAVLGEQIAFGTRVRAPETQLVSWAQVRIATVSTPPRVPRGGRGSAFLRQAQDRLLACGLPAVTETAGSEFLHPEHVGMGFEVQCWRI